MNVSHLKEKIDNVPVAVVVSSAPNNAETDIADKQRIIRKRSKLSFT